MVSYEDMHTYFFFVVFSIRGAFGLTPNITLSREIEDGAKGSHQVICRCARPLMRTGTVYEGGCGILVAWRAT
jgi:hypothetical protein